MKLKLIATSMSLLGLISSGAYAAEQTTTHKTMHHKRHHHVIVTSDAMPCELRQPCVTECGMPTTWYQPYLDSIGQNTGRAKPTVDCNKPLAFAGGVNFDYHLGNRHLGYMGENTERYSVNDAYIDAFGRVNEMVKAFVELSYNNASLLNQNVTTETVTGEGGGFLGSASSAPVGASGINPSLLFGGYSNVYPGTANGQNGFNNLVGLQQAYITIGDLNCFPVYLQLGRQFQDYGRYQIHPITRSLTQVLTETLRTSANLGFVLPMGFHGQIWTFDTPQKKYTETHSSFTYGASLGYDLFCDQLGYGLGISYISNMFSVNDVDYISRLSINEVNPTPSINTPNPFGYQHRVGAIDIYGHINTGPFSFVADYTTALQNFSIFDIRPNATAYNGVFGTPTTTFGNGAKPWAFSGTVNYAFNYWCKNQNVYVGYQTGDDLALFSLPSSRWLLGYNIDMWKNTTLGVEWNHDNAYGANKNASTGQSTSFGVGGNTITTSTSKGRSGNSDTVAFRAAVHFG